MRTGTHLKKSLRLQSPFAAWVAFTAFHFKNQQNMSCCIQVCVCVCERERCVQCIFLSCVCMCHTFHLVGQCVCVLSRGSILSTRCSETFETKTALMSLFGLPLWYFSQSPRVIIQVRTAGTGLPAVFPAGSRLPPSLRAHILYC